MSSARSSTAFLDQPAPLSPRALPSRRPWSVASSAIREAPGFDVVRRWVATLAQGAIVPCDGGTVSLLPRSMGGRAAVAIDLDDVATPQRRVHDAADVPCDLLLGASAIDHDELARMQSIAAACAIVYAPNLTSAVSLLRRLAAMLVRVEIVDDARRDRQSGVESSRSPHARRGIADEPGLRLAALRVGDGVDEHALFVAVPTLHDATARPVPPRRAFAPKILDAAAFVASAERGLRGLSALKYR